MTANPAKGRSGRISKQAILRPIVQLEMAKGEPVDVKKILLIAQKKLEEIPVSERNGVVFRSDDVSFAVNSLRKASRHLQSQEPVKAVAVKEVAPQATYSGQDLLNARRFLRECDHSLVRAKSLLDLVSTLLQGD